MKIYTVRLFGVDLMDGEDYHASLPFSKMKKAHAYLEAHGFVAKLSELLHPKTGEEVEDLLYYPRETITLHGADCVEITKAVIVVQKLDSNPDLIDAILA